MVEKAYVLVELVRTEFRAVKVFPTLKFVVVAAVPVAEPKVRVVMVPLVANSSVVVAAVVVARPRLMNWYVEEALTMVEVAESEPTF